MNPLNFYTHPDNLNYEKDVDQIGRDLIKQINQTDYLRTTMYCSGHFEDEVVYPFWGQALHICFCVIDCYTKEIDKLITVDASLYLNGYKDRPIQFWDYYDSENQRNYTIGSIRVEYKTKEERQMIIDILKEILN